ncbi:Malectin-like carbohydrate-binding domain containing protein [Trema orientale]|uniref:Malectin-like carbohydrate-binding domain containing protein n=1 Tax=Trema orientale TaxID=63057 RepID=A0A2P5EVN9_TREOI|nr:Malectin-like carbohydrate-binding domain containing protein [Trema orientale]
MENWTMMILVLLLVALLHSFQVYSDVSGESWLSIDCGATTASVDALTLRAWETDDKFIATGENKRLSTPTNLPQMATLRSFPNGSKNCYNLPLKPQSKYLVRAGFHYGNYDNLQNPPTFDLQLQSGNLNVNVTTSLDFDPIYHEFITFTTERSVFDVCLIRTQENQVPFISTLEATIIDREVYRLMNTNMALSLVSRINYGVGQSVPDRFNEFVEKYNRIWKPQEVPGYLSSQFGVSIPISYTVEENNPPDVVMYSAIEANNASESIVLPIDFPDETQVSAYFILYFDIIAAYRILEDTRTVSIFIEGQLMNTTRLPGIGRGEVVSIYPVKVTGGTANLTVSPAEGTTSPALLNAIEVFSVIDVSKVARSSDSVLGTSFGLVPFAWLFYYCMVWYYRM